MFRITEDPSSGSLVQCLAKNYKNDSIVSVDMDKVGVMAAYLIIYLFTAIGLLPGGSGYFTSKQNMKLVTTRFKSGELHEKHVVATWNVGNRLSICL